MLETGVNAGIIWQYLEANGATKVTRLAKAVDRDPKLVQRAIGWLLREGKVSMSLNGRIETISNVDA